MPLVPKVLAQAIIAAQVASAAAKTIPAAQQIYADALATAIDAYIKSGDVAVTGPAGAMAGKVA